MLYRFAGFDPFARSRYFGCSLDLGQFERFRRIFYTPCFSALLNHTSHTVLSQLEVAAGEGLGSEGREIWGGAVSWACRAGCSLQRALLGGID